MRDCGVVRHADGMKVTDLVLFLLVNLVYKIKYKAVKKNEWNELEVGRQPWIRNLVARQAGAGFFT